MNHHLGPSVRLTAIHEHWRHKGRPQLLMSPARGFAFCPSFLCGSSPPCGARATAGSFDQSAVGSLKSQAQETSDPRKTETTPFAKSCGWEYRLRIVCEMGDNDFVVLHHWGGIHQFLCEGSLSIRPSQGLQKRCGFPEGQE